ncbi:hypothetical protein TNCT_43051 [Trichonephila clavata]|uniref:Uncharacterized protein n=1 Tax=Trichonephila clavata TaxID=2740835 RepID=A0A8X6J2P3_TRICU|nr:hypothetical protein TNCT_43051 [Trichonephila clavata]
MRLENFFRLIPDLSGKANKCQNKSERKAKFPFTFTSSASFYLGSYLGSTNERSKNNGITSDNSGLVYGPAFKTGVRIRVTPFACRKLELYGQLFVFVTGLDRFSGKKCPGRIPDKNISKERTAIWLMVSCFFALFRLPSIIQDRKLFNVKLRGLSFIG